MVSKDDTIRFLQKRMSNLTDIKTDLTSDLSKIFKRRLKRFKNSVDDEQSALTELHIKELDEYALTPYDKNKIYIIHDVERILLASYDLSNAEVSKLVEICEQAEEFDIDPKYISTLYIFKKGRITFQTDLYPNELSGIIKYFQSRNIFKAQNIMEIDTNDFFSF
ncbi:MAG: hypothetical protein NC078_11685 [Ruminococcus sp.]|nr:hypothetical protein [Ruminococcus sp.]